MTATTTTTRCTPSPALTTWPAGARVALTILVPTQAENELEDVGGLAAFTALISLDLAHNSVLAAPAGLPRSLLHLSLAYNRLEDASPLAWLSGLVELNLGYYPTFLLDCTILIYDSAIRLPCYPTTRLRDSATTVLLYYNSTTILYFATIHASYLRLNSGHANAFEL